MIITIDPYYDVQFYNETLEALKNNKIQFKEFISTKPPYDFYLEVQNEPMFINYDKTSKEYSRWLVNIIKSLKPNDDYIYRRRESYTNKKAINHYAINDALKTVQTSGEGIFFNANKEEITRISKEYPRKIYYFGKYFKRKYRVFLADQLIIRNFLNPENVLVQSDSFKHVTELEVNLNYNIFLLKDRLEKLSETPYVQNGKYYPIQSVRPEITDKYTL